MRKKTVRETVQMKSNVFWAYPTTEQSTDLSVRKWTFKDTDVQVAGVHCADAFTLCHNLSQLKATMYWVATLFKKGVCRETSIIFIMNVI